MLRLEGPLESHKHSQRQESVEATSQTNLGLRALIFVVAGMRGFNMVYHERHSPHAHIEHDFLYLDSSAQTMRIPK